MNKAYLLTGGNLGNPLGMLHGAKAAIASRCGPVVQASAIYQTAAWGKEDQPDFLNQVLLVHTSLRPMALLQTLQQIEKEMGRERIEKYGPRLLDIDILLFNNLVIDTPALKVPHPQMAMRRFVLTPLAEIAAYLIHPVQKISISQMLMQCTDPLDVHKL